MMDLAFPITPTLSRSKRIKQATSSAHDRLDQVILDYRPFAAPHRYRLFLRMQHGFHGSLQHLYRALASDPRLSGFRCYSRFSRIEEDLRDLGENPSLIAATVHHEPPILQNLPSALGWLYVAEGSNLGAAFLLKEAMKLGFSETFGARHLAAPAEGRGAYWRSFTAVLDAIDLPEEAEAHVIRGAQHAFESVRILASRIFTQEVADQETT